MRRNYLLLVFIVLFLSIPIFYIVCAPSSLERVEARMMKKITNPEDEQMARGYVQQLQEHAYGDIEKELDPGLRTDDLRERLTAMSELLPNQDPKSVKVIGYQVVRHPDLSKTITVTLEYEFSNQWFLAEVVKEQSEGRNTVTGLHLTPIAQSVEQQNRFKMSGKHSGQYGILLLSLTVLIVSIYAFVCCLRTPMGRKKWFWAAVCLFGIGRIAVNWTTGAIDFTPIWFGIPPAGAFMAPLYSPWFVYTSFPMGAMIFLIRRSSLNRAKPSDFPEPVSAGSATQE
jgi:hypothetical protein